MHRCVPRFLFHEVAADLTAEMNFPSCLEGGL